MVLHPMFVFSNQSKTYSSWHMVFWPGPRRNTAPQHLVTNVTVANGEMPWMFNEKKQKLPPANGRHQGVVKDIPIIGEEFPPEGQTMGGLTGDEGSPTKSKPWQSHRPQLVITSHYSYPASHIEQDYALSS